MPKTKEQKQQEALHRQELNFYRSDLATLIRSLPGGSAFNLRSYDAYDELFMLDAFDRVLSEAKRFKIKVPYIAHMFQLTPAKRMMECLSTIWLGQIYDLYEKAYKKHGFGEEYSLESLMNEAGKEREKSNFGPLSYEVFVTRRRMKNRLDAIRPPKQKPAN